jgi:small subunit ribosomal protein S16
MLSIRLKRIGKKHQASYRVVVAERRSKLFATPTEDLGWYDPKGKKGEFKAERIKYWMSVGAGMSATVHNLLLKNKVLDGKKIAKHKQPKKSEEAAPAAPAAAKA